MALSPGNKLGPYEIVEPIGKGGMGEVFRAHDPRMDRDVAIKTSTDQFSERFSREVRAIAALNHPNICHLYDVGPNYLVMELVEGQTLAERIKQGPIELQESLRIARQIADALEAAHEKGITHRDLKPGNVILKEDGTVKVLDFGLAKMGPRTASSSEASPELSPTLSMAATQAGVILGTAAYMSPEQARGKNVDKRADIWAFGVVLFEMVTGKKLFSGEDLTDTLARVVRDEADLSAAPPELRGALAACLEKEPKDRLRDIGDVWKLVEMGRTQATPQVEAVPAPAEAGSTKWLWPAVAAVGFLAALGLGFTHFGETPPIRQTLRYQIPTEAIFFGTLSPDGRHLAYRDETRLWIHSLDELEPRPLPGTDGASYPFWSPDGEYLGFFAQNQLKKIAIAGGPAVTLAEAVDARGGTWSEGDGSGEGVILFARIDSTLMQVSSGGGTPEPVTSTGNIPARFPSFLPDGVHFFYNFLGETPEESGVYIGSLDDDAPVRILPDFSQALYAPPSAPGRPGYVLFRRGETLMAQPFDPDRLETTGEAVPVAEQVAEAGNAGFGAFSVSSEGVLVYVSSGEGNRQLVWTDRAGNRLGDVSTPGPILEHALSPDGTSVAMQRGLRLTQSDIWAQKLDADSPSRLTFSDAYKFGVRWAPDGNSIFFGETLQSSAPALDLVRIPAGGGNEKLLLAGSTNTRPLDVSRDGRFLLYSETREGQAQDLLVLPLQGDPEPVPYLETSSNEESARFSPDGRWIAYASNESGLSQIYVQDFPATGRKYQITTVTARWPSWREDGRELFFWSGGQLIAVPVTLGETFQHGTPQALFRMDSLPLIDGYPYDPSADGQRFLVNVPADGESGKPPFTVVTNWQAELKP